MNYLTPVLYGIIVGNFLWNTWGKLVKRDMKNRYAVVAQHCNFVDVNVLIGYCSTQSELNAVIDLVDDSTFFMGASYDMFDGNDVLVFNNLKVTDFNRLSVDERMDLEDARALCVGGR